MKYSDIISKIANKNQMKITWISELSDRMTKDAKRRGFIVTKEITSIVKLNKEYKKLPCGSYLTNPSIVKYKNNIYLKIIADQEPEVKYYVNGTQFTRSELEQYPIMQPKYWLNKNTKGVDDMILNIQNITKMEAIA